MVYHQKLNEMDPNMRQIWNEYQKIIKIKKPFVGKKRMNIEEVRIWTEKKLSPWLSLYYKRKRKIEDLLHGKVRKNIFNVDNETN